MAVVIFAYFASARAAASGVTSESFEADTIDAARVLAEARHGAELARIFGICSFLLNGAKVSAEVFASPLSGDVRVDVLPPFAGG